MKSQSSNMNSEELLGEQYESAETYPQQPSSQKLEQQYLSMALQPSNLLDLMNENQGGKGSLKNYDEFQKDRQVHVQHPELIKDGYVMSYKLYRIMTKKKGAEGWETTVCRRFNDFEFLNYSLLENYGGYVLPRLPDKNILASFNLQTKEFQESRVQQLTKYLERLLHHPQVRLSHELRWFLFDEEYNFSSEKGEFIEQTGNLTGIRNITESVVTMGKSIFSRYLGQKEVKQEPGNVKEDQMEIRVFVHEIEDLVKTTKEMKSILSCSYQQLMVMSEFIIEGNKDAKKVYEEENKRLERLIEEFNDISEFIQSCHEAIQRTQLLKEQVEALEKEEMETAAKESQNPRNRELDSLRSKLHRLKAKYQRWMSSLKKQLQAYTAEGKTLMEDFVKKFIEEKSRIYGKCMSIE